MSAPGFRAVLLVLMLIGLSAAAAHAGQPGLRQAVVRIEMDVDAFSFGPELSAETAARQPVTSYAGEIQRRYRMGSTGTGFFVNANGDLVTNAHVFLSGVRYRNLRFTMGQWDSLVRLLAATCDAWVIVGEGEDARVYAATPVAIAEDLDLAILRVSRPPGDTTKFAFVPIASSEMLQVKQSITALGFPSNEFQASAGEVLSLIHGAQVQEEMRLTRRTPPSPGESPIIVTGTSDGPVVRIQHSAVTGHGSSGGPLLDSKNRVIGVCYALLADRNGAANDAEAADLNIAIASDVLKRLLRQNAIPFTEAAP